MIYTTTMHTPVAKKLRKTTYSQDIAPHSTTFTGNSGPVSEYFVSGELTGKERDPETGLYYYGARYLDPRTSRWISADPAMWEGDYIPGPGKGPNDLRGEGGIYNFLNFHVYHYGGNNPIRFTDPDGEADWDRVINGALTVVSGSGQVNFGILLLAAATGGTAGSGGAAAPLTFTLGLIGFSLFVDGFVQCAFGLSELAMGLMDVPAPSTPTNTGGIIGAAIDTSNGHNRSTQGPGPAEQRGAAMNRNVSTTAGTVSFVQGAISNTSTATNIISAAAQINDVRNNSRTTQTTTAPATQMGANQNQVGPGGRSGPDTQQRVVNQNEHRGYTGPPGF